MLPAGAVDFLSSTFGLNSDDVCVEWHNGRGCAGYRTSCRFQHPLVLLSLNCCRQHLEWSSTGCVARNCHLLHSDTLTGNQIWLRAKREMAASERWPSIHRGEDLGPAVRSAPYPASTMRRRMSMPRQRSIGVSANCHVWNIRTVGSTPRPNRIDLIAATKCDLTGPIPLHMMSLVEAVVGDIARVADELRLLVNTIRYIDGWWEQAWFSLRRAQTISTDVSS